MGLARWRGFFDRFNSVQRNAMLKWMRKRRWWILLAAWLLFFSSLWMPAIGFPNLMFLSPDLIPVRALPLYGILELSPVLEPGGELFALFGMLFFLASPLLLLVRSYRPIISRAGWVAGFALLLPWGILVIHVCLPDGPLGRVPLLWGYYLFAAAQTLAFVACAVDPPKLPKANRQRGFAVLPSVPPPPVTR
jgi:hypothetical protein